MINKIYEEALSSVIKRIEVLEEKMLRTPNMKSRESQNNTNQASIPQKNYLRSLGGNAFEGITKQEAGQEIDKLLQERDSQEFDKKIGEETSEPEEVDTDDAGLDGDLM